jgi:hypothetical protein
MVAAVLIATGLAAAGSLTASASTGGRGGRPAGSSIAALTRDPTKWPYSRYAIWNMPIGAKASYTPANLVIPGNYGYEENLIVMTPGAPKKNVYQSRSPGWDGNDRCPTDGQVFLSGMPIPDSFTTRGPGGMFDQGNLANAAGGILKPDGRTVVQTQPLISCPDGTWRTRYYHDGDRNDDIITGQGIVGAQGGSGMSSIGGALRMGELTPTSGHVRHALKITVWAKKNLYFDTKGYRWPAYVNDGYADKSTYGGTNPQLRQGSLLAIPIGTDLTHLGLSTKPAKELAWTLQHYGAYIVDDSAWDDVNIAVEHSPDGNFLRQFKSQWGFDLATGGGTAWKRDLDTLFGAISVVSNNGPTSVGGGGRPLWCYAPAVKGDNRVNPNGAVPDSEHCITT